MLTLILEQKPQNVHPRAPSPRKNALLAGDLNAVSSSQYAECKVLGRDRVGSVMRKIATLLAMVIK